MLGSLGVIVAALVIMYTGWILADPIIGAGIGLFIVPRTWSLLKQAVNILMEGAPAEVDLGEAEKALFGNLGVIAVRDLHVWTNHVRLGFTDRARRRERDEGRGRSLDESQGLSWKKCSKSIT